MKGNTKDKILRSILRIYLILFSLLVIAPLVWAVYTSFKTNQEFFKTPGLFQRPSIFKTTSTPGTRLGLTPTFLTA